MLGLSILMAAVAAASSAPNQTEMLRVADAFDRAQLSQDRQALEAMVDDELVFIESSGKRSGKKEFVGGWTDAGTRYNPIQLIDRTVTPLGDDAFVVSAETTLSGTSGDKAFSSRFRFSDTFRRRDGRWQAIHIQVTRIGN
ncbi:MAG TPA: nuclear transport factor 2 family protein [Sphingomicrobium sp.]